MGNNIKLIKLTAIERDFCERISAISGKDTNTVRAVFLSVLIHIAKEFYSDRKEFYIPYVGKIGIEMSKGKSPDKGFFLKELFTVKASPALHNVLLKIDEGNDSFLNELFVGEIKELLEDILDIHPQLLPDIADEEDLEGFLL